MAECPYCEDEYSRLGRHAPYCDQKPEDVSEDEAKIESVKARSEVELSEDKLIKWYFEAVKTKLKNLIKTYGS